MSAPSVSVDKCSVQLFRASCSNESSKKSTPVNSHRRHEVSAFSDQRSRHAKLHRTALVPSLALPVDRERRAAGRPAAHHKPKVELEPRVRFPPVWTDPTTLRQAAVAKPLHLRDVVLGSGPASGERFDKRTSDRCVLGAATALRAHEIDPNHRQLRPLVAACGVSAGSCATARPSQLCMGKRAGEWEKRRSHPRRCPGESGACTLAACRSGRPSIA